MKVLIAGKNEFLGAKLNKLLSNKIYFRSDLMRVSVRQIFSKFKIKNKKNRLKNTNQSWKMIIDKNLWKLSFIGQQTVGIEFKGFKILQDPWFADGAYYGSWFHYPSFDLSANIEEINPMMLFI